MEQFNVLKCFVLFPNKSPQNILTLRGLNVCSAFHYPDKNIGH